MELNPLEQFLAFGEVYASLGTAIRDQLNQIIEGNFESVNPNAIDAAKRAFRHSFSHPELCEAFEAYDSYLTSISSEHSSS